MSIPTITAAEFCARKFDYLVVGGGTAGLVVAARLSEHPDVQVGVIEAGPAVFDEPSIDVPGRFGETLGTEYDWQFETTPQPGLAGRRLAWPRGKLLGGTSALNFMIWNRGSKEDYDAWKELGNYGWGWDGLLPFFKKSETFSPSDPRSHAQHGIYFETQAHGTSGPIQTTHMSEYWASHVLWQPTLNKLGIETNKSHFSGSNVGAWTSVCAVDAETKKRSSSTTAYYLPNSRRPNLCVLPEALANEVVLDSEGGKWAAKGVRFSCKGEEFTALASTEVILSAGSVQSPQLLELSGIGNPQVLQSAGVTVRVDNPNVGENLQEHMMTAAIYEVLPSLDSPDDLKTDPSVAEAADLAYTFSKTGPRTILSCALSYVPVSQLASSQEVESLESRANLLTNGGTLGDQIKARRFSPESKLGQVEYLFDIGNWSPFFKTSPGKKYATMLQILQYPFSKGSIHIPARSDSGTVSVNDKPVIDPRYYVGEGGQIDLEVLNTAQKFADRICMTEPLSSIIVSRVFPPLKPGDGDEDFSDYLRNYTITDWHPVGTCAMGGTAGQSGGVVDDRLRVYGVEGLRVVDASIMPLQVSCHIQATVYAIAEKGAAMILEDRLAGVP